MSGAFASFVAIRRDMSCWLVFIVFGCFPSCTTFHPRPIDPLRVEAEFRGRTLTDLGLRAYIEAVRPVEISNWPPRVWDLTALTLVAFYYHPDLDVARATWRVAQAGIVTAAARPNPSVTVALGYASTVGAGISPWLMNLPLDIPVETAGKRGYRIAQAVHLSEATRLNIAATAWQVRSRLRTALLELYAATQTETLLNSQKSVREEIVTVMEQRLAAGEISQPEITLVRLAREQTRLAVYEIRKQLAEARVQLAEALGVTVEVLNGVVFDLAMFDHLPPQLPSQEVQRQALLSRPDVLAALAEYAATESALQLEIAKQYPDIHFGPSYELDTGDNKWFLGPSMVLPVLNRNEGPLAEAQAHRTETATRFTALQARVIGEVDRTLAGYQAARNMFTIAGALFSTRQKQLASTRAMFDAGEADRLALLNAQLELDVGAQARLDALVATQQAFGLLEDAVQRPLGPLGLFSPALEMSPRSREDNIR